MYINSIKYFGTGFGQSTVAANMIRGRKPRINTTHKPRVLMDEKYSPVDSGFKRWEVVDTISKRIETMPMMMDDAFETVTDYVSCKMPRRAFISKYNQTMIPLYKRIENGYNAKEYSALYKPEITALNKITDISKKYNINRVSGKQFDYSVEKTLSEYSSTELNRKKNFVI